MTRTPTVTRYELVSVHNEHMNVYLDSDVLTEGARVSLWELPDTIWTVVARYETVNRASIRHGWDNNI